MLIATDSRVLDGECDLDLLVDCVLGEEQNAYEACGFFFRKIKGQWCELEGDEVCCGLEGSDCCKFHALKTLLIGLAVVVAIAACCFLCCCRGACCPPQTQKGSMETGTGDSPSHQPTRIVEKKEAHSTGLRIERHSQVAFGKKEFPPEEGTVDGDYYDPSYHSQRKIHLYTF